MLLRYFSIISFSLLLLLIACSPEQSEVIVAEYGKYKISIEEFENAYAKNVGSLENAKNASSQDYYDFMDLYVKFKMKLRDAEVRGYTSDPELEEELTSYQKQVGVSYLIEKEIIGPGIYDLYEKRKEELRVSHLMIRPDSSGVDAAQDYANSLLDSIKNGASFEEMVKKYSQDQFSAPSGGDIFYITAGLLPVSFEDAMYKTNAGEVYPEAVQTRYGSHLIKITEKGPRIPKIKASHILISYFNPEGQMDSAAALLTVDSLEAELKAGVPFDSLVLKYSDDTGTKNKGGDLGFFERRMMVKEFDEAAFKMEIGEISEPIQTNFGYHIIKLTDKMEYPSFEEERENLKEMYEKQRYQFDYDNLINSLRVKYNYNLNDVTVDLLVEKSDSVRFGMEYPNLDLVKDEVLFTCAGKTVTAGEFLFNVNSTGLFAGKPIFVRDEVVNAVSKVSEDLLKEEEALNLDKINPEFAALMNDYRDGIYIFKLQEEEVWNNVKIDSASVYNFWNTNKENYSLNERISFSEIFSMKDSLINTYYKSLIEGASFDSLANLYTERPGKKETSGFYELQDVDFSDFSKEANKLVNVGDYSEPTPFSGGYSIFILNERQSARLKTFDEAKAEVSGKYQEMESSRLEEEYINSLNTRYNPVIFYDELGKAFKKN
ncbi:MAG: peptidylprolyl isomerase [Ignavibacteria bacterium]|nr:peptidylprolyl isomerase [Ignavibacteria bacterium]